MKRIPVLIAIVCTTSLWSLKIKPAKNLGKFINTAGNEFAPTLNKQGDILIFNSKRNGYRYHNLYQSKKIAGKWSRPKYLSSVNSRYNDETPILSSDGKILIFSSDRDGSFALPRDRYRKVRVSFDLYWSFKQPNGWSYPKKIPRINSVSHERTPSISIDGKYLYYMQWPFGKIKQAALYQAQILSNFRIGNISKINFPKEIKNIHLGIQPDPKNKGFYFSSQLAGGFGQWDLYHISYENGLFGKPVNLGKTINSPQNEVYFSVAQNQIYFCSDRKMGFGLFDIYGAKVPQEKKLYLRQFDALTKKATHERMKVEFYSKKNKLISTRIINQFDKGIFSLKVPDQVFSIQLSSLSNNYLPYEKKYQVSSLKKIYSRNKKVEIDLHKPQVSKSFDIYAIHFDYNSAVIQENSLSYLKNLASYLEKNPSLTFKIIGHTDLHGSHRFNKSLSTKRALSVKKFLIENKIKGSRIKIFGAGKRHPVINKVSKKADLLNRRTEFKVLTID